MAEPTKPTHSAELDQVGAELWEAAGGVFFVVWAIGVWTTTQAGKAWTVAVLGLMPAKFWAFKRPLVMTMAPLQGVLSGWFVGPWIGMKLGRYVTPFEGTLWGLVAGACAMATHAILKKTDFASLIDKASWAVLGFAIKRLTGKDIEKTGARPPVE